MKRIQAGVIVFLFLAIGCSDNSTIPSQPPEIREVTAIPNSILPGSGLTATCIAVDSQGSLLTYTWRAATGSFADSTAKSTIWTAPDTAGNFRLYVEVDNGAQSSLDSVTVLVGSAQLSVNSYPPGVFIVLNGDFTPFVTPHVFDELPIGDYTVALVETEYMFQPGQLNTFLGHRDSAAVEFSVPSASFSELPLGRQDFEFVGPPAYLADGQGVLYTGTTTTLGDGLYSTGLSPETGAPNGLLLTNNVRVGEAVTVSGDGRWVVYTGADNRMTTSRIHDPNRDGVVDSLTDHTVLKTGAAYGLTLARDGRMAWSPSPSENPASSQIVWGTADSTDFSLDGVATTTPGRRPSWRQDDSSFLAWEAGGEIMTTVVPENSPGSPDTLIGPEGFNQSPAWGKWGTGHIAYINGPDEMNGQNIVLQEPDSDYPVPVFTLLFDPQGLAWSPAQKQIAASVNPGSGKIYLIFNLPIP